MKNALKVRLSKLRRKFNPGKLSMRHLLLTTGFGDYQRDIEARAVKNVMFVNSLAEIQGSGIWTEKYPKNVAYLKLPNFRLYPETLHPDYHPTPLGYKLIAESIFEYLLEESLIPCN